MTAAYDIELVVVECERLALAAAERAAAERAAAERAAATSYELSPREVALQETLGGDVAK